MLIVLDCSSEDSDVRTAIDHLRQLNPKFPVLVLTSGESTPVPPVPPSLPVCIAQTPGRQRECVQWLESCTTQNLLSPCLFSPDTPDTPGTAAFIPLPSVLVVDDTPLVWRLLFENVKELGAQVCSAEDGMQALEHLEQCWHPLVLTDYHMPNLDGVQFTKQIREREARGAFSKRPPIYIVALTADTLSATQLAFSEAGANGCLHKPLRKPKLLDLLHKVCAPQSTSYTLPSTIHLHARGPHVVGPWLGSDSDL